jgi:hypothetical protein
MVGKPLKAAVVVAAAASVVAAAATVVVAAADRVVSGRWPQMMRHPEHLVQLR